MDARGIGPMNSRAFNVILKRTNQTEIPMDGRYSKECNKYLSKWYQILIKMIGSR